MALNRRGRSIGLYGDTDTGKTTQTGQYMKWLYKTTGQRSRYNFIDKGSFASIEPLVDLGIVEANIYDPSTDPWIWIMDAATGVGLGDDIGCTAIDGASGCCEEIMNWITNDPRQFGQQKTQRFTVANADGRSLTVGANNEAHYGLVQNFMRSAIFKASQLTSKRIDVVMTFGLWRGEGQDGSARLGPLLAGKALTPVLPKWFTYFFPLVTVPTTVGEAPRHLLYTSEQPEFGGTGMCFANARYPLEATTPLPAVIEPASLITAIEAIEQGQREALENVRLEVGR